MDPVLKQEAEAPYNKETKAALGEYEEMKRKPGNYKRYESFDELLDEIFNEIYGG